MDSCRPSSKLRTASLPKEITLLFLQFQVSRPRDSGTTGHREAGLGRNGGSKPASFRAQNGLEIHQNKKHGAALRYPDAAAWMPSSTVSRLLARTISPATELIGRSVSQSELGALEVDTEGGEEVCLSSQWADGVLEKDHVEVEDRSPGIRIVFAGNGVEHLCADRDGWGEARYCAAIGDDHFSRLAQIARPEPKLFGILYREHRPAGARVDDARELDLRTALCLDPQIERRHAVGVVREATTGQRTGSLEDVDRRWPDVEEDHFRAPVAELLAKLRTSVPHGEDLAPAQGKPLPAVLKGLRWDRRERDPVVVIRSLVGVHIAKRHRKEIVHSRSVALPTR
jgi:hypothetical protein